MCGVVCVACAQVVTLTMDFTGAWLLLVVPLATWPTDRPSPRRPALFLHRPCWHLCVDCMLLSGASVALVLLPGKGTCRTAVAHPVARYVSLSLTAGSENMKLDGVAGLKSVVEVLPYEIKKVCTLMRDNPRAGCSWKFSYSLRCVAGCPVPSILRCRCAFPVASRLFRNAPTSPGCTIMHIYGSNAVVWRCSLLLHPLLA